jgi:hypothetical protein
VGAGHAVEFRDRERDYRFQSGGKRSVLIAQVWAADDLEQMLGWWSSGRRIPREVAWKMEAIPELGERAQFGSGEKSSYLHFVRANVYVVIGNLFRHDQEREALIALGRAIDARIIEKTGTPAFIFKELLDENPPADVEAFK